MPLRCTPSPLRRALAIGLALGFLAATASASEWADHVRRFTAESPLVHDQAVAELRKDPEIREKLRKALGTSEHFLALDAIAALNLRSLLPTLYAFAEKDKTGFTYHVINTLIYEKEHPKVIALYRERLKSKKSSLAAKMALLDSLGRLGADLENELLQSLLTEEEPEVRSAALYFLRTVLVRRGKLDQIALLKPAIRDPAFQIRMQALSLVSEIPRAERDSRRTLFDEMLAPCVNDPYPAAKGFCEALRGAKAGQ
jgi:hypothetical protein